MATTQTSPWAGVPYAADVTQADVQPPPAVWAAPAPDLPAPTMPTVTQKPRLDPHAGLPQVFAPVDPQEQIAEHLQGELQNDYHKDADPYGSPDNHPGFLGKLAHALSHATGGDTRRQWEEQGLAKQINDVRGEQFTNADRGETAAHLNEDTAEMPQKAEDAHTQSQATTGNLESETKARDDAAANPSLVIGHAHAVNQALKEGRDPAQDPIVQQYEKAIQSTIPGFNKPDEAPKTITAERPGFKGPHEFAWNPKTKAYDIDEGEHYERPMSVNINGERAARNDVLKAYQPTLDSAERMNVMTESYEKAIKDHDQQAMLNLLANHLGMTMGLQKGARITRDLYQEAAQSTPWLQKVGAKFDKDGYLSGVTLNPTQMRQMVSLAQSRYSEDAKKSRSTAQYLGAQDDGPQRIPGKSTINFYLGLAHGDPARAKSLAAQDGWSVQ